MKLNEIHITEDSFVKSNLKYSHLDINCILKTYGSRGILVDMFKMSKKNSISIHESLSVIIGKTACIGEEWNFKEMNADSWKNVFNPKTKYTTYVLKEFKQTDVKLFLTRYEDYMKFLKDGTITLSVSKPFRFNGSNTSEFYMKQNIRTKEEIKTLEIISADSIINCYSNEESWHWNVWIIETEEDYIMYEENICD